MTGQRWVVTREGETELQTFKVGEPGQGEILLRTEASLVSAGTELAIFTGIHQGLTNPNVTWPKYPQAMGYMGVTRVEAVGPDVTRFHPGQRLLTSTGHASLLRVNLNVGTGFHAWDLPDDAPAHRLVFARMAKTAVTAVARTEVTLAQSVAVVGLGIIGQVTLRLFEAAGAWPLFGVDPVALRRDAGIRGGATACFDPSTGDAAERLREHVPNGADIVIDATGWAAAFPGTMALACDAGTVVVLGSPRGRADNVDVYSDLHRRSLRILGAHDSGIGPTIRERFPWTNDRLVPALVEWVRRGKLPVEDLITHHVPPSALPEMYQGLLEDKDRFLGVVIDWSGAGG